MDDTNRPQFDDSPWPWVVNKTYPHPKPEDCSAIPTSEVNNKLSLRSVDFIQGTVIVVVDAYE